MGFFFFFFLSLSTLLITMLLIDWLEAVDYHGPLVTRYLMMRGERDERRGGGGGGRGEKEGWKLDEHGQCSHHQISLTLFLISLFTLPLHICIPRVQKLIFVHLCVFVRHLDVRVCGPSRHTLPACLPFRSQTGAR